LTRKEASILAHIIIITTAEEHTKVLSALKDLEGKTVSVSEIARKAGMNPNRVRYVISDLVDAGRILRIPTKAFNKHYVRYKYEITQEVE